MIKMNKKKEPGYIPNASPSDNLFIVLQNPNPRQTHSRTHIPSIASKVCNRSYEFHVFVSEVSS